MQYANAVIERRLGLRVSLYGQMLTSQIRTELASTHMNVDNVCELTSTRLRTDQRRLRTDRRLLRNGRWRNHRWPKRNMGLWWRNMRVCMGKIEFQT